MRKISEIIESANYLPSKRNELRKFVHREKNEELMNELLVQLREAEKTFFVFVTTIIATLILFISSL